jgi:hypothetical protein
MTEGNCPSCGAPVRFAAGDASVVVCGSCQAVVARTDRGLEEHGKLAALVDTDSPLSVGMSGRCDGVGYRVTGRLQRSNGTSTWDEWALWFDDMREGWLSESEGTWRVMFPEEGAPEFRVWNVGVSFSVGKTRYAVEEVGHAKVISGEGELPRGFSPGVRARFAEATGPAGTFAYVERLPDEAAVLFVGRGVTLSALGLETSGAPPARRKATKLKALKCTQCNGPLELRAPDLAKRVGCPFCGALLDCSTGDLRFLEKLKEPKRSSIPLGTKGKLFDVEWTCLARLKRSCAVDGVRYPWVEYLFWNKEAGFRWLMESNGHWTWLEPLAAGDVTVNGRVAECKGTAYKLFQKVEARTDEVMGECYWEVAAGDVSQAEEYVAPPHALNLDRTLEELSWTFSTYLTAEQVKAAFQPKPTWPAEGVAPSQPNPLEGTQGNLAWAVLACILVLGVHVVLSLADSETVVFRDSWSASGVPGSTESIRFGGPFKLPAGTQLEIIADGTGLMNSWAGLEVDLVDQQGEVTATYAELGYYEGVEDGESWEDNDTRSVQVTSRVPAGTYDVRLVPTWSLPSVPEPGLKLGVMIRTSGPRFFWVFWAWVLLLAAPMLQLMRYQAFETERWSESNAGGH